jgi:3-phosphoshikimate 1-carboxyvinyltransferase
VPLCACLGGEYTSLGQGKLLSRPNEELFSVFSKHGVKSQKQQDRILISGKLTSGEYSIRGDISSQYISGLLMALPTLNGDSKIILTTPLVSKPYVDITLEVLRSYGIEIIAKENGFIVKGGQKYIGNILPEGDWSNIAFFLAGASVNGQVEISNLNKNSVQGDKKIVEILRSANANIKWVDDRLCVLGNKLKAFSFDAENCPDIVPILAVVASFSLGTSVIKNIQRLKIKESDRIESTLALLKAFGIKATCDGVNLTVYGGELTKETPIINS